MYPPRVYVEEKTHEEEFPVEVNSNGSVMWLTPHVYHSTCLLDIYDFPWDRQTCNLTFGSWTHTVRELDLVNKTAAADSSVLMNNGEWHFLGAPASLDMYPCDHCKSPFAMVTFSINIQRKALYYIFNLFVPSTFLAVVGLLVFLLPPDNREKISLSVSALLGAVVFLLILNNSMPIQSKVVPLAGKTPKLLRDRQCSNHPIYISSDALLAVNYHNTHILEKDICWSDLEFSRRQVTTQRMHLIQF